MGNTSAISPLGWDGPWHIKHSVKGWRKWNLCDRTGKTLPLCVARQHHCAHGHRLVQEEDARAVLAGVGTVRTEMTLLT